MHLINFGNIIIVFLFEELIPDNIKHSVKTC